MDINDLPEIKDCKEFIRRNEFQKKLLLDSYHNLNEMYLSEVRNTQNAWESSNNGWTNYEQLCKKLKERGIKI